MSPVLFFFLAVPLLFFAGLAVVACGASKRNMQISRIVVLVTGLPLMAFCCYGALASLEGSGGQFLWARIIYLGLFCAVAVSIMVAWWPRKHAVR